MTHWSDRRLTGPFRSRLHGAGTLRRRLAIGAAVSLVVTAAMTALVVDTARTARAVVQEAELSHARNQAFYRLQYAADFYQRATYAAVRDSTRQSRDELARARSAFVHALGIAESLPIRTARDAAVHARTVQEGDRLLRLFGEGQRIVAQVDERWHSAGSIAALREIQTLSAPYFNLVAIATDEVRAGDDAIRAAAARASRIQSVALPAAFAGMLLSLLVSGLLLLIVLFRLSPGLRHLEERAHSFGAGDMKSRIDIAGDDELSAVAHAFNGMADQIEAHRYALQDTAVSLEEAVRARTSELERAHASLAAEDQRRRIFFAEVSHELRTPITIIQGEAQVALRSAGNAPHELIDTVERILDQSKDLGRLVGDLFLIARAEAQGLDLHIEEIAVQPLLSRLAQDFEPLASELGGSIRVRVAGVVTIEADRTRLRQVISALVNNAFTHCPPGVAVELVACNDGDAVLIEVLDDGPGVDPGSVDQLLLRFRRGNSRAEGSGLGLTIVRALAEAHSGTVSIANRARGGLVAQLRLPAIARKTGREERVHV